MSKLVIGMGIFVLILGMGFSKSSGARRASRAVSFTLFAVFAIVAGLSLVGTIALASKGGGVLIFLAIPCAFIAWLFFNSFQGSLAHEPYYDLNVEGKVAHNQALIDSQMRAHQATIAENSKKLESFWITPGKRRRLRDDLAHARFMLAGLTAMKDKVDDPEIYKGDEA